MSQGFEQQQYHFFDPNYMDYAGYDNQFPLYNIPIMPMDDPSTVGFSNLSTTEEGPGGNLTSFFEPNTSEEEERGDRDIFVTKEEHDKLKAE